jgi:ABC-type branched-subunit amino acid transport system substrate-binding protein
MKRTLLSLLSILCSWSSVVADEFKIPVLVGQTGASSTFGKVELDGYTLAVEAFNQKYGGIDGRQIALTVDDTRTDQATVVSSLQRLFSLGHKVVLGPTWLDGVAKGAIPVAKMKKALLVSPSAEFEAFPTSEDGPITFYYHSRSEVSALLKGAAKRGLTRVSLIYEQEPFAELIKKLLVEMNHGSVSFVNEVGVQAGESDFKSILPRITKNSPQAYLVLVWDERSLLTLLQTLSLKGDKTPILTIHDGEGWLTKSEFAQHLPHLIYSRFVLKDKEFSRRFKERFGYEVHLTGSNAYDAMWSVLLALKDGARDAASIRSYLTQHELQTTTFGPAKLTSAGHFTSSEVEVIEHRSSGIPSK